MGINNFTFLQYNPIFLQNYTDIVTITANRYTHEIFFVHIGTYNSTI